MIEKVVSGGQTGVDRAALDAALELGIEIGGWCPKGRLAEDGIIHARYPLIETPSDNYGQRTEWNVRDSDATLILHRGVLSGGTAFTFELAHRHGRPSLALDLLQGPRCREFTQWIRENRVRTLNVAGPRESGEPGIHRQAGELLRLFFNHERSGSGNTK